MAHVRLVLASESASRRRVLADAGIPAEVVVSGVDETIDASTTVDAVAALAERKATAVAAQLPAEPRTLVLGCDSLLDVDGTAFGKPDGAAEAQVLWRRLSGRAATLCTGHCLIDTLDGVGHAEVARSLVRFGTPSAAELEALVATGEPLAAAGGFTIEGHAGPFVESIDGHPSAVLGLSLPVLRRLLADADVRITDLWH